MGFLTVGQMEKIPSMLIYGDNGVGKTHLWGTNKNVPEMQPSLLLDFDKGGVTIQKQNPDQQAWRWDESGSKIRQLVKIVPEIKKGGFKSVCIDTISTCMYELMEEISGGSHPQFAHWNTLFREMLTFITSLKAAVPIVVATAFPSFIESKVNGETHIIGVTPLMNGKAFPKYVMNEFNIIAFLNIKTEKTGTTEKVIYTMETKPNGFSIARDRFSDVGTMKDPDFAKIVSILKGEKPNA